MTAGPDPEDDVPPGDGGNGAAEVGLDHPQHHHPGSDARGGPHTAVLDMDGIVLDGDAGAELSERVELAPMRCCPPAVQRAGRGQEEGAAAAEAMRGTRPIALATISVTAPRASSACACGAQHRREQGVRARQAPARHLRQTGRIRAMERTPEDVANGPALGAAMSMR